MDECPEAGVLLWAVFTSRFLDVLIDVIKTLFPGTGSYVFGTNGLRYRACTVDDIPCIFKAKDIIRTISDHKCHCPVLCHSVHFQSEISFGSISKLALQQIMKKTDVSGIISQFINAREVSQRKWKHVARAFKLILDRLQKSLTEYEIALNARLYSAIQDSIENIKHVYHTTSMHWKKKRYYFRFQEYVLRKNILRGKEAYDERYFMFVAMNHYGFTAYITNVISSLFNTSEPLPCNNSNILLNLQAVIKSRLYVSKKAYIYMQEVLDSFRSGSPIFEYRFHGQLRKYGRAMLPKVLMKTALTHSWNARNYGIFTADSIQEIVIVLEKYFNFTENICSTGHVNMSYLEILNKEFVKKCQRLYHNKHNLYDDIIDWSYNEMTRRIALFEEKWNLFESSYNAIEVNFLSFLNSWNKVNNSLSKIRDIIGLAQNYITNTSITKVNLYEEYLSPEISSITDNISTFKTEIYTRATSIIDQWKSLSDIVQDIWKMVINDTDMKDYYELANKTQYLVNISTILQEIKRNFNNLLQGKT
ncbi:hypothetical protein KUTeg_004831 [Tegillarca granosa]|uniref:Uncharacterized protein n=1 Tax=Tegillarca granosa TaxID=220873 RepID=A0ABQ9FHZ7_TEGGR|nr:hypothetical protein KUTeg_004831 [Tegillarca granosa]